MVDMFSFAILLHSIINDIPNPWLIFFLEAQKNVIYIGLSFVNLIMNTVNPFPLTKVHLLSSPLSTPDLFGPLAVLMWTILKNL
jgi:hypothetical protein